jgi:hypothetical protein
VTGTDHADGRPQGGDRTGPPPGLGAPGRWPRAGCYGVLGRVAQAARSLTGFERKRGPTGTARAQEFHRTNEKTLAGSLRSGSFHRSGGSETGPSGRTRNCVLVRAQARCRFTLQSSPCPPRAGRFTLLMDLKRGIETGTSLDVVLFSASAGPWMALDWLRSLARETSMSNPISSFL